MCVVHGAPKHTLIAKEARYENLTQLGPECDCLGGQYTGYTHDTGVGRETWLGGARRGR